MDLNRPTAPDPYELLPAVPPLTVRSDDLVSGEPVDVRYAAAHDNLSPHLAWDEVPAGTQSFAVTCFDPDAPTPSGFWHWAVMDIPADVRELATGAGRDGGGSLPSGAVMLRNDYGTHDYGGPNPPAGDRAHRYYFAVHALDVPSLGLPDGASVAALCFTMLGHQLARGVIVSTFQN